MGKATRQAFGEHLAALGEKHPEIVVLDADLSKSTKSEIFAKKFPQRFFEMGIAEANMIGTAAGLSFAGKLPFLCSFGCFITGRYDTIRVSGAYAQANIRLVGTHAGVGIGEDGHSQMGLEDMSLMRSLPTMGVFQPMDAEETRRVMDFLVSEWKGPAYLRLTRQDLPDLYPIGVAFRPTKLMEVGKPSASGKPVLCVSTGALTSEAVAAQELLSRQGVSLRVLNAHCLKPFDEETLLKEASGASFVLSAEDHTVVGGLGTCVAEAFARKSSHPPLVKIGVQDVFGESGTPEELYQHFGFTGEKLSQQILAQLGKA